MMTFKPGDTVAFSQAVIRRTGHGASARGTVVSVHGRVARVDWHGTWIPHEDGSTVRSIPAANLTRVLANGAVFGDQTTIITRSYALRLIRAGRTRNPVRLRPDERGRVYVAIDVQYARGWTTHHYLEDAP